jgi:hypothetical protein
MQNVDEVSVLRDAHWLGEQNTDLCPDPREPDYEIARRLCEAGYLEISAAGRILGKDCYRLTEKGHPLAAECRSIIESEREELRSRICAAFARGIMARPII